MGQLKPGATYIYERAGGVIYAREFGKTEREVVGYHYDPYMQNLTLDYELETVWKDILSDTGRSVNSLNARIEKNFGLIV